MKCEIAVNIIYPEHIAGIFLSSAQGEFFNLFTSTMGIKSEIPLYWNACFQPARSQNLGTRTVTHLCRAQEMGKESQERKKNGGSLKRNNKMS